MTKFFNKLFSLYLLLPTAVVLFWVFVPFVRNLFVSNTELLDNRPLNEKPEKLTRNFAKEFEAYYNDTFAGRKSYIKKLSLYKLKLGMDSGFSINGKEGWLFYDSGKIPDGYTLVDYFGRMRFSDSELREMADGLKKASAYYKKRGIEYYLVVAPNKEGLYSEFMPDYLQRDRVSEKSRTDLAIEYLQKHTDVNIINFRDVLAQSKDKFGINLYYPRDSHWNEAGAYLSFVELAKLMRKNGVPSVPVKPLRKDMLSENGYYLSDLNALGKNDDIKYKVDYLSGKEGKLSLQEDNGYFAVYENSKAPVKKTVFMIRDSFGLALIPYFDKTFAKNIFAHNKYNKRQELDRLVAEYKPDIMVDEVVERYFDRLLKYNELYGE